MRFALLALVGLLCLAGDAHAGRFGFRRANQQQFNGCNQQFRAPAVAFVAPVQQHHFQQQALLAAQLRQQQRQQQQYHHQAPVVAVPVIAVPVHGGAQFFAR